MALGHGGSSLETDKAGLGVEAATVAAVGGVILTEGLEGAALPLVIGLGSGLVGQSIAGANQHDVFTPKAMRIIAPAAAFVIQATAEMWKDQVPVGGPLVGYVPAALKATLAGLSGLVASNGGTR